MFDQFGQICRNPGRLLRRGHTALEQPGHLLFCHQGRLCGFGILLLGQRKCGRPEREAWRVFLEVEWLLILEKGPGHYGSKSRLILERGPGHGGSQT